MMEKRPAERMPDREELGKAVQVWLQSSVAVADIRQWTIEAGEPIDEYRMPSSMFVCSYGGPAEVRLNETLYSVERFGLFHGGKGTRLSIRAAGPRCDCYALYYKAEEPPFYKTELRRLLGVVNPFRELYGFAPRNPIFFVEQLREMHERWNGPAPLQRFFGKAAFYRFVCEIYEELERGNVQILRPDVVALVKRHIDGHYREAVSLQAMAEMFHVSAGHLSRLFKKQEGVSPQEYLIRKRVEAARTHLLGTDATLREIAWSCGFSDEFHLIKTFKSHFKMTPGDCRKISSIRLHDTAMGYGVNLPYSDSGLAMPDHFSGKGEYSMFGTNRSKTMVAAAALSLMLMLSACSSAPAASPSASGGSASSPAASAAESAPSQTAAATKEFEHAGGKSVVPVDPQRIVADWYYGELLALGVRPVGYPQYLLSEYPYRDAEGTEGFAESMEQIVEMKPDLIISTWDDSYKEFSKIAPSVLLKLNNGVIDKMRVLGQLVNREEEAEKWIASFEEKLENARQRLADNVPADATVTILSIFQKDVKVYGYRNMGGDVVYNLLQMKPPEKVREMFDGKDEWNYSVSFEELPEIAGTHIILTAYDPEDTGRETLERLEQSQIWQNLDAVKHNRVHKISYYDLFFDDPIATEHQIDMLTDKIAE
ncbi:AraC family transcriptional regulator [Cohnella cellulosilytica]|uniref:AraC family transcriptional regulator n=1 Tax=Cohnella cellulosilytica TaxID=986710 RepID=A0ABW2FHV2_9BACL